MCVCDSTVVVVVFGILTWWLCCPAYKRSRSRGGGGSGSELLPHWGVAMKLNISQVFSSYFDLLPSLCSFASDVALYIYFLRRHFVLHRAKHLLGAERKHSKLNCSRKIYRGFLLVTCVYVCIMYVCIQIYILRGCLALVKDATCLIVINSMSICFHFCRLSLHKFEILHFGRRHTLVHCCSLGNRFNVNNVCSSAAGCVKSSRKDTHTGPGSGGG